MIVRANEVSNAREVLLGRARQHKNNLTTLLEGGERDYEKLSLELNNYMTFLKAADVLAGYNVLDIRDLLPPHGGK